MQNRTRLLFVYYSALPQYSVVYLGGVTPIESHSLDIEPVD